MRLSASWPWKEGPYPKNPELCALPATLFIVLVSCVLAGEGYLIDSVVFLTSSIHHLHPGGLIGEPTASLIDHFEAILTAMYNLKSLKYIS